jgi:hypothetical protein
MLLRRQRGLLSCLLKWWRRGRRQSNSGSKDLAGNAFHALHPHLRASLLKTFQRRSLSASTAATPLISRKDRNWQSLRDCCSDLSLLLCIRFPLYPARIAHGDVFSLNIGLSPERRLRSLADVAILCWVRYPALS